MRVLSSRLSLMNQLQDIKSNFVRDQMQKAKIQWAIEGDENSKFFHGIVNRKRVHLSVKGIMVDGEWVDEPTRVKEEFRSHFASRFQDPGANHNRLNFSFPSRLSLDQISELEKPVSSDEIRKAVWSCGDNKSPGPDGFSFEFFRKFWDLIGPDMCIAVDWFFTHNSFSRGCNASFISLIPKVHDPKHKKQQAMVFKVDFAKAYDSIRWDYLDDVLKSFGFGVKWRSWIASSLSSGMASILVNGSPTFEFQLHCGLKQGYPLAPYLFIIVMESLHLSVSRAIEAGFFSGIKIDPNLSISHLFYVDDAVFIGELVRRVIYEESRNSIHFFSLVSGLKINLHKSQLLGVGVASDRIIDAAGSIGCSIMKAPFKYLGVMVGGNMSKINAWDETAAKATPVCMLFPRLYALDNSKDCTVASKLQGDLAHSFRRPVRGGVEADQLDNIMEMVQSKVLSDI
ncbi:RNA-directed DNA polymerase, eukaryota [Tanacetum coccineum]